MYYAMVVVVQADDLDESFERVTRPFMRVDDNDEILFVGEPWEVKPISERYESSVGIVYEPEFGTLETLEQHPEK